MCIFIKTAYNETAYILGDIHPKTVNNFHEDSLGGECRLLQKCEELNFRLEKMRIR